MNKPRVFIASSVESLEAAEAVNVNIEHLCEATLWHHAFNLSSTTIEDLVAKSSELDYAIFIFAPDDLTQIRDNLLKTTRDNVVFELGLFIGAIGRERCFIIKPRNCDLHLPSDLLGMTVADYDAKRSDNNLAAALTSACTKIKSEIAKLGLLSRAPQSLGLKPKVNSKEIRINKKDIEILGRLLRTHSVSPDGMSLIQILGSSQEEFEDWQNNLSVIKLVKIGYADKSISQYDYDGSDYYTYTLTSDGLDFLISQNEAGDRIPTF